MTEVSPAQTVTIDELQSFAAGSGLNGPFVADLLSSFVAHEQCGAHLYRTVAGLTQNPMLAGRYKEFLAETEHHVDVLQELITKLGGDPFYVSPMARLVHGMDAKLIEAIVLTAGSAEILDLESAMLEAVLLAETKDHGNWSILATLAEELDEGEIRSAIEAAVGDVGPDEDEHLVWARTTWERMTLLQARSSAAMTVADLTERLVGAVSDRIT